MTAFDSRNYQIVFEEAIKCPQFRKVFQQFLEKHHNEESILFINKVIEYVEEYKKIACLSTETFSLMMMKESEQENDVARRSSVKIIRRNLDNLQEKMQEIVKSFLQVGGEQELNIGPHQKAALNKWKETNKTLSDETFPDSQEFHGMACPYGIKIMTTTFDTKIPLLKKRFVESSVTCLKDSALDMYMILLHSAQFPEGITNPPPNSIIIDGLCYYIMMRVNENTTRFLNIMYTDFQLPLQNMTIGQFCKMRGKTMAKGLNFILDKLTDGGKHPVDTSKNDDRGVSQRIVNDNMKSFPNRSWFMEWKESQSRYNTSLMEE